MSDAVLSGAHLDDAGQTPIERGHLVERLVHAENFGAGQLHLHDRGHFMRWPGRVMRSVIVDFARRRQAPRRGGGAAIGRFAVAALGPPDQLGYTGLLGHPFIVNSTFDPTIQRSK